MKLRWERPTVSNVRGLIRSPIYAGAYVYGRRYWRRAEAGAEPLPEGRLIGQFVARWDHHKGYIDRTEFLENQRLLALNAKRPKQAQLGPGPSLLQGRCFCSRHGAMAVHYHPLVRTRAWSFRCLGDYFQGGRQCITVPGIGVEAAVVAALLNALDVPIVEEAHQLWRAAKRDWRQNNRLFRRDVERKEEALAHVRERLLDPSLRTRPRVKAMLEDEYEKLEREIERLRGRVVKEEIEADPFTETKWTEVKALCSDVRAIWEAPTTSNHDRKQIVRVLIRRVVVQDVHPERVNLVIDWADGRPQTPIEILRTAHFHRLLSDWDSAGVPLQAMVVRLSEINARTRQGRPWSLETVRKTVAIIRKRRDA